MRPVDERFARQARNEALFRDVNERITQLAESTEGLSPEDTLEFLCECGDENGCGERIRMPLEVYERVRAQDDRFAVKPGHETLELETAVEWTDDYVIVDKVPAAEPFVADDPRGAPSE